ncbi:MAG: tyrosine--tRNA ligase [Acholeplasmataceae bacterium]
MKLYDDLIWRGMIKDVSDEEKAIKHLNDDKVKFYCGFDPTGESLTVGHLVQIVRMLLLQKYGHTPIALIGGATGLIGDPKQTSERKLLTLEESLANATKIKNQLSYFLGQDQVIYVNNYDWIKNIDTISFLRDFGKNFNINYMLAKDTVQRRLDIGISYTEFSYMIIQAIDFLELYRSMDCKIQFGGSDQWGNITSGLELIRKTEGDKNDAVGLSSPLLLKADGTKFGKSESGALWIDQALTSPYELYQYFVNASDKDVSNYLRTLTLLDKDTIEALEKQSVEEPHLRAAQKVIASEVVKLVHGQSALDEAIRVTEALFNGSLNSLNKNEFLMLAKALDTVELVEQKPILDCLIDAKLAQSKREAREFLQNGAITLNEEKVSDVDLLVTKDLTIHDQYVVLRRGKKKYAILKFV